MFVAFDAVKHVLGTFVEMGLKVGTAGSQEVDESSLFDKVVFSVNANEFNLLLSFNKVLHLNFFNSIGPLVAELLGLVAGVDIVEYSEFGTGEESEMTGLNVTEVNGKQVLVVENHVTDPVIVRPSTETRDGSDRANVSEDEKETASASAQGFVVRGHLLGSNGLEESLEVAVSVKDKWASFRVIRVLVTLVKFGKSCLVVTRAVLSFVFGLWLLLGSCLKSINALLVGVLKLCANVGCSGELCSLRVN